MLSPGCEGKGELAGGAEKARVRAKAPGGLLRSRLDESDHVSAVEVGDGHGVGFGGKRGVDSIVDPQLPAVDGDRVDQGVAAVLPVRIDLHRADGEDERSLLPDVAPIGDTILDEGFACVSQSRRPQFDVPRGPDDARNGQRALDQGLADRWARRRTAQRAVQPQQGHDLAGATLRLEVAVFVEQRFLGLIEFSQRCPIDLASEERLRVEVAAPGEGRPLQLADGHAVLIQDAQLEFVDDGAFRRTGLVHRQAEIAAGG